MISQTSLTMKVSPFSPHPLPPASLPPRPPSQRLFEKNEGWFIFRPLTVFVFDPRRRVPEGQVRAFQRPVQPFHPGRAVHERRQHAVGGGHGAAGQRLPALSQQEAVCHRYQAVKNPSKHPHPPRPSQMLTLFPPFVSSGRYMADC